MTNLTAAIVSPDTFEIDGDYYPALITHPGNTYIIEIVPITDDPRLADVRVILGRADLEDLDAKRAQSSAHIDDDTIGPSEPFDPDYDCRTTSERLDALETAMRVDHRTMHATFNEIESRLDALIDQLRAEAQGTLTAFAASDKRLDDLEAVALPSGWKTAVERNLDALGDGLTALTEQYWPVSTEA